MSDSLPPSLPVKVEPEVEQIKAEQTKVEQPKDIAKVIKHISHWREIYIFPLFSIGLLLGALYGVSWLVGRPLIVTPETLLPTVFNYFPLIIAAVFTNMVDRYLFNDLDCEEWKTATLGEKILDVAKTLIVFAFALLALNGVFASLFH